MRNNRYTSRIPCRINDTNTEPESLEKFELAVRILRCINVSTDGAVVKGGMALALCYGLDRAPGGFEIDDFSFQAGNLIEQFVEENGIELTINKTSVNETEYLLRYMSKHALTNSELKIKVLNMIGKGESNSKVLVRSEHKGKQEYKGEYRSKILVRSEGSGIQTYRIRQLFALKHAEFLWRNKLDDLYDIAFIVANFSHLLKNTEKLITQRIISMISIADLENMCIIQNAEDGYVHRIKENFRQMRKTMGL